MFFTPQFFVFLSIGLVNAFNGVWLAYAFSLFINPNLAFIIGYLISLSISYGLNSRFTFHAALSIPKYIRFCLSYIPNFFIQNLIVLLVYNYLQGPKIIAFILAAALGVPITFLLLKIYAFRTGPSNR